MNPKKFSRFSIMLLASFAALPLAASAAEEAASEPDTIGEIIVTATKRDSTLHNVPFSIAAVTDEKIRETGSQNLVDLSHNVVSLAIADLGPGQSQVAIRGISSGQVIRDQPGVKEQVGVYLDESPISVALFTPDLDLYDLDRFEVLRGPQGTLFGAGSTAGTLRYITAQPKLGQFEGSVDLTFMDVSKGDTGGSVKGAVNLPVGETMAVRIVGYYNRIPGFVDALQPDGSIKKDVNTGDKTGGRVAFLFAPSDNFSITPRIVYQKLETDGYPRADLWNILGNPTTNQPKNDFGNYQQYRQQKEGIDDEFMLGDLKLEYDFGPASLAAISSYTDRRVTVLRDATQLTGSVTVDVGGTDPANDPSFGPDNARISSPLFDRTKLKVFSQELRLASSGDNTLDWLVGAFYQDVDRHYGQDLPTPGYDAITVLLCTPPDCPGPVSTQLNAPPDTPFYSNLFYKLKQYGIFGEATWRASDQWAFTAGLRYYDFTEDRVLNFGGYFSDVTPTGGIPGKTDSNGFSPRFIVSFKPTENIQLNAQVSKGFRLGGINDPINVPLCSADDLLVFGNQGTWKDEKNTNYEIGAKMRSADRRYTLNVSAFVSDIKDLQATTTAGSCSSRIVFNVPEARSQGYEVEFYGRPTEHWDFGLSFSVIDAELLTSVTSTSTSGTVVVGGLEKGNQLPTAGKFQSVASIGYTLPVMGGSKDLFANLTWQHQGSSYSQFENEVANFGQIGGSGGARIISLAPTTITSFAFDAQLPAYDISNFRIGLKADDWEAALFVNNLGDKRAILALDYERGRSARVGNLINQPRTIGVSLRKKF